MLKIKKTTFILKMLSLGSLLLVNNVVFGGGKDPEHISYAEARQLIENPPYSFHRTINPSRSVKEEEQKDSWDKPSWIHVSSISRSPGEKGFQMQLEIHRYKPKRRCYTSHESSLQTDNPEQIQLLFSLCEKGFNEDDPSFCYWNLRSGLTRTLKAAMIDLFSFDRNSMYTPRPGQIKKTMIQLGEQKKVPPIILTHPSYLEGYIREYMTEQVREAVILVLDRADTFGDFNPVGKVHPLFPNALLGTLEN